MIGFDRRIVDGRGLDPEEVLKLILILAARHELGQGHRQQGPTRIRTGSETSHRHGHEDRRGFLSRGWKLNRKSSARRPARISVSGMEAQQKIIGTS